MSEPFDNYNSQAYPAGPYPPAQYSAPPVPAQVPAVYQGGTVSQQPYAAPAPQWQPQAQYRLVSPGARFGAACLDLVLVVITLGIGWWIWSFVTWSNGQSPAKSLLGHVVADPQTGQAFDWGKMAMREFVIRTLLIGLIGGVTFGILALIDDLMIFGTGHRTLHDQMAGSIVRY